MMATALKQLPSAVDQILLPDVWELFEHWSQWPPSHRLLRDFVGYEPPAIVEKVDPEAVKKLTKFLGLGPATKPPPVIGDMVKWAEEMKKKMGITIGQS